MFTVVRDEEKKGENKWIGFHCCRLCPVKVNYEE